MCSLSLSTLIGINSDAPLLLHPSLSLSIFSLGSSVILRDLVTHKLTFLRGHDARVSCIAISPSGEYVASGQQSPAGFPADVLIWHIPTQSLAARCSIHKGAVQGVAFSSDSAFVASIGGKDDNAVVVWAISSVANQRMSSDTVAVLRPLCGTTLPGHFFNAIAFLPSSSLHLITAGGGGNGGSTATVKLWQVDTTNRKLRASDVNLGSLKRQGTVVAVGSAVAYIGTSSGDLVTVDVSTGVFRGLSSAVFAGGVRTVTVLQSGDLLVGTGGGEVVKVTPAGGGGIKVIKASQLLGGITSIAMMPGHTHAFVLTDQGNTYVLELGAMVAELRATAHTGPVVSVAFPLGLSAVFLTAGLGEVRVWAKAPSSVKTVARGGPSSEVSASHSVGEILRITVPNIPCHTALFTRDGRLILTGWGDGKIRAFLPQSGKLAFVINDAHRGGVTALAALLATGATPTSPIYQVVSGGLEGEVRVWRVSLASGQATLVANLKEHKSRVNAIELKADGSKCLSASSDGSCIVWGLAGAGATRELCVFEATSFETAVYGADESQILTGGADRKITFWDAWDGQAIRTLEGGEEGQVGWLDMGDGVFVSGGGDGKVKLWGYDEGVVLGVGEGHSGAVNMVKIAPGGGRVVSVGEEGGILLWDFHK